MFKVLPDIPDSSHSASTPHRVQDVLFIFFVILSVEGLDPLFIFSAVVFPDGEIPSPFVCISKTESEG